MSVRQYVGARYVPLFMGDWDVDADYEPLSIVQYQGNSYTSRQSVPHGIDITNTAYWAVTGNYNAQVEAYRQEVRTLSGTVSEIASDVAEWDEELAGEVTARENADTALGTRIDNEITARENADNALDGRVDILEEEVSNIIAGDMVVIGDSTCTTGDHISLDELWIKLIADRRNLTLHNYAVNGAGFVRLAQNFLWQAQRAQIDDSYDHDNVKLVIVAGGINDMNADAFSTMEQNFNDTFALLKSEFPYAEIVFVGPNRLSTQNSDSNDVTVIQYSHRFDQYCRNIGIKRIPSALVFLGLESTGLDSATSHPNAVGNLYELYNFLNDGWIPSKNVSLGYTSENCSPSVSVRLDGNILRLTVLISNPTSANVKLVPNGKNFPLKELLSTTTMFYPFGTNYDPGTSSIGKSAAQSTDNSYECTIGHLTPGVNYYCEVFRSIY